MKFQEVFDNWKLALSQYAKFEGRSNRAEYWHFFAVQIGLLVASVPLIVVFSLIADALGIIVIVALWLFWLGTLVPYLAVSSRRLRDTGQNPLLLLVHLVPLIGPIAIFVLCAQPTAVVPTGPSAQPSKSSAQPPFCESCGKALSATAAFCSWCGKARPHSQGAGKVEAPAGKGDPEADRATGDFGEEPLLSGPVDGLGSRRRSLRIVLPVLVVGAVVAGILLVRGPDDSWPDKITFGFVDNSEFNSHDLYPITRTLEEALGIEVEPVGFHNFTDLAAAMRTGKADLAPFGPFGYVFAKQEAGRTWWNPSDWVRSIHDIDPLIQAIRYGSATYHGQWMTNDPSICDSPPQSGTALENTSYGIVQVGALDAVALQVGVYFDNSGKALGETVNAGAVSPGMSCTADLSKVKGKRVVFTSESSTSGYLYPALQLIQAGIDPVHDIVPIFAGGHDASVAAVYNRDADIGVSYDDARRSLRKTKVDVGKYLIVFNITAEIPNDVVAASSRLPDSLQDAIYNVISAYLMTDAGGDLAYDIFGWGDMRRAVESDFDIVREVAETFGIEL